MPNPQARFPGSILADILGVLVSAEGFRRGLAEQRRSRGPLMAKVETDAAYWEFVKAHDKQPPREKQLSEALAQRMREHGTAFAGLAAIVQGTQQSGGAVTCETMAQRRYAVEQAQFAVLAAAAEFVLASRLALNGVTVCFECPPLEPCWCPPEDDVEAYENSGPPPVEDDKAAASRGRKSA